MARGRFRTKGAPNWAHVEYEPGWTTLPITEQVYRERAYEPRFDELPWRETARDNIPPVQALGRPSANVAP
jgi:hypothetical protein